MHWKLSDNCVISFDGVKVESLCFLLQIILNLLNRCLWAIYLGPNSSSDGPSNENGRNPLDNNFASTTWCSDIAIANNLAILLWRVSSIIQIGLNLFLNWIVVVCWCSREYWYKMAAIFACTIVSTRIWWFAFWWSGGRERRASTLLTTAEIRHSGCLTLIIYFHWNSI